jgi:exodeoxyribonuclease-3
MIWDGQSTALPKIRSRRVSSEAIKEVCNLAPATRAEIIHKGVALLSRSVSPVECRRGLPETPATPQPLSGAVNRPSHRRVPIIYPMPIPKFDYKERRLECLDSHAKSLLNLDVPAILCGDYNVVSTEIDAVLCAALARRRSLLS